MQVPSILYNDYFQPNYILQVVAGACRQVKEVLYVHLDSSSFSNKTTSTQTHWPLKVSSNFIQNLYGSFSSVASSLDTRVVMTGFKGVLDPPSKLNFQPTSIFVDHCDSQQLQYIKDKYQKIIGDKDPIALLNDSDINAHNAELHNTNISGNSYPDKIYRNIVAGGTFDKIHAGHKILLAEGLLRCTNRFTIGVADGVLLSKKTLTQLIEPVDIRITNLRNLLQDMDSTVEYCLEPIEDPCGPSGKDPRMEMIIVSQETLKGGAFVNKTRQERGLNQLDVEVIDLIEDSNRLQCEEEKLSSSSGRMRLLGTLLRKPEFSNETQTSPYIIGLTGQSASGKSSIAKRLCSFGAGVIDCDKLGHKAYLRGTHCYNRLVEIYGTDILNIEKEIDRKALGVQVFGCEKKLQQLNELVWPEIMRLVKLEVCEMKERGVKLIVIDAAVLLEAKWENFCHEVNHLLEAVELYMLPCINILWLSVQNLNEIYIKL